MDGSRSTLSLDLVLPPKHIVYLSQVVGSRDDILDLALG